MATGAPDPSALRPAVAAKMAGLQGTGYRERSLDGRPQGRAQRGGPGRKLGHHGLGRHVHEDVLAVDARSVEERHGRVPDPPAVAVVSPGRIAGRVVPAHERLRAVGSPPDRVVDPRAGHDDALADPAVLQVELAEPGQVAQGRADASVGHRVAVRVDGDLRVELGAHRLPQLPGDELVQPRASGPLNHPRQHVGEDRAVPERAAVRPVVRQRREVAQRVRGPGLPVVRAPQVHPLVGAHVGFGIVIALVEPGSGPHVQQVLHGRALERGAAQFRDDLFHPGRDRQLASPGEHSGDRGRHRLGHRHQQVRDVGRQAVEVMLGHHLALVQHQEAVGVGLLQQLGYGQLTVGVGEPQAEDVALGARQRPGRPFRARDLRRRDQLADVLEGPPVERRVLPVRERHPRLRGERRRPGHQRRAWRPVGGGRRLGESSHRQHSSSTAIQKTVIPSGRRLAAPDAGRARVVTGISAGEADRCAVRVTPGRP